MTATYDDDKIIGLTKEVKPSNHILNLSIENNIIVFKGSFFVPTNVIVFNNEKYWLADYNEKGAKYKKE